MRAKINTAIRPKLQQQKNNFELLAKNEKNGR